MCRAYSSLVLAMFALVGCQLAPDTPDGGDVQPAVTYYDDVRPILAESCAGCHDSGGIAPFALRTYEQVSEVGERIAEVTRDRIMPPFLADASGDCNHFANERRLTDAEIETLGAWVRQGMPEGDASLPEPPPLELPRLESVDLTLDMGAEYAPNASGDDDYRCFVVETGLADARFLTGYQVRPGNPRTVHHVIVYQPASVDGAQSARAMDGVDGRPGYTCFGGAVVFALPVAVWAPGVGATLYPEGTGIRITPGMPLVIQVHYNLAVGDAGSDRTRVELSLRDEVADEARMGLLADFDIELPPRRPEVVTDYEGGMLFAPLGPMRVWGAFPHMHTLGRALRVEATGSDRCLIDVPRWDFNWQSGFFYEAPIDLDEGQWMRLSCTFDTMERDETTNWGDGTADEMCLSFFYVTGR